MLEALIETTSVLDRIRTGIDSIQAVQMRKQICNAIPSKFHSQLPINLVYESGSMASITQFVTNILIHDMTILLKEKDRQSMQCQAMVDMVSKYINIQPKLLQQTIAQSGFESNSIKSACISPQNISTKPFLFCSSVANVANKSNHGTVSKDPIESSEMGYAQSKWVIENVLATLSNYDSTSVLITVLRIGQLSADTKSGSWNRTEAWLIMLNNRLGGDKGFKKSDDDLLILGRALIVITNLAATELPPIDWLLVDVAASWVLDHIQKKQFKEGTGVQVTKICGEQNVSWKEAQWWILEWANTRGRSSRVIDPEESLDIVEAEDMGKARALVGLWRIAWVKDGIGLIPKEKT